MSAKAFAVVERNWKLLLAEEGIYAKSIRRERIFAIVLT